MALSPRLELKTSQTLVMTPQLQQAIKLLQMSNLDLSQFVEQEIEKNPLLEVEGGDDSPGEWEEETPKAESDTAEQQVDKSLENDLGVSTGEAAPLDTDYENDFEADSSQAASRSDAADGLGYMGQTSTSYGGGDNPLEQTVSEVPSLRDHIMSQLTVMAPTPQHRLVGQYIVDFINEAGYLTETVEAIADRLGADLDMVEETLALMQSCDPVGVGARSVAECLALQLKEKDRYDPAMQALLDNLDLLAKQDFPALMRVCGVDREDLGDMLGEIRELNPKPGSTFGADTVQPVVPDVFVRMGADGGWQVELNSDTLPRVLINSRYYANVRKSASAKEEKAYISDCLHSANWLVKALDQRAKTILKVASEIVRQQDNFLRYGVSQLRPLNLRMVAEAISMHESTVSRVTANKYLSTPRGIFEMRYFFSSAVGGNDEGAAYAAESVRHRIKQLIDEEPPKKILSDDKIVELLKKDGIDVARRTVAKYREAMGIPSSVQRRRLKRVLVP